jgi:uncharacterized protein
MKIGILSDTHKKIELSREIIEHLLREGAQFFIHAGDIGTKETLDQLKNCGKKYIAVYGNNDASLSEYHNNYNLFQEPHYFKLADTKIKLMHLPFYLNADADVIIFGHTHTFECDFKNRTLFLNSGEACGRNKKISECAMLEIKPKSYEVTYYAKSENQTDFEKQHFSFERV